MNNKDNLSKKRKRKQFTVIRNFNGKLTASEYIARLAQIYQNKDFKQG